ncbi:MAG: polymerase [Sphingomonas bacterium]|uniref:DNA polymerase III subunit delta' n=1 Tax=Sphingomonas bacterium TaxID=1895847 RepID=UPI0026344D1F|nr:DNA polymerase III subunit delta' [Sphingomonas bacterium]MDB5696378.1 polymerase [Sphingomonas bacterium]
MTSIIGNTAAQDAFAAALAGDTLHHAWLLAGPKGVGKGSFARQAAARLVGGGAQRDDLIAARAHPDYRLVEREQWETGKKDVLTPYDERKEGEAPARSIRVVQIRWLRQALTVRPSMGERRAVIIDAADDLEPGGANALLKSLEEPPPGTVFLLVSHAPGRLLPTIRSRCRLLRFGLLDEADMSSALRSADPSLDPDEVAALVEAGEGAPGRALRFAGLDVKGLDAAIAAIAADGDPDNARRSALARALAGKAAQPRYEAFLDRAPSFIARAARRRSGPALAQTLDAHTKARDMAGAAVGLSLDQQATVWEMSGILAGLPRP